MFGRLIIGGSVALLAVACGNHAADSAGAEAAPSTAPSSSTAGGDVPAESESRATRGPQASTEAESTDEPEILMISEFSGEAIGRRWRWELYFFDSGLFSLWGSGMSGDVWCNSSGPFATGTWHQIAEEIHLQVLPGRVEPNDPAVELLNGAVGVVVGAEVVRITLRDGRVIATPTPWSDDRKPFPDY